MTTLVLPARCDRAAAEEMLPEMRAALDCGPLAIDGSRVEKIGQAMLQLLLSAQRTGEVAVIQPSPALIQAARLTGLSEPLLGGIEL